MTTKARLFVLVSLGIFAASLAAAQPRRLSQVHTILVMPSQYGSPAMQDALVRALEKSSFRVVSGTESADAYLGQVYGCSTITGEYLPENQRTRALCFVRLSDAHSENADGILETVWMIPAWRVNELYSTWENALPGDRAARPTQTVQEYVAAGVVADLERDRSLDAQGQAPPLIETHRLSEVKTIFVSQGDYSYETAEDKFAEDLMARSLIKWGPKDSHGKNTVSGNGWSGVESVIPGVRLVFAVSQADAILLGPYNHSYAGPVEYVGRGTAAPTLGDPTLGQTNINITVQERQTVIETGMAFLLDRRTGKVIWSSAKDDSHQWLQALSGQSVNTGSFTVIERLVKQLKKDREKAR